MCQCADGAENIVGWERIDVVTPMETYTGLPVRMGNDANMMGLGEMQYGAGRNCTDIVFLTIGTGIGGAIIIGGKLFSGYANRGAELGLFVNDFVDGELIVRLYREGHPLAVQCMNEHFYYLGRGIAGFVNVFSPQRVVIGGGICETGDFYLEELRKVVAANAIRDCAVNTQIVRAELGNRAGLIGAASQLF